jgi:integrase
MDRDPPPASDSAAQRLATFASSLPKGMRDEWLCWFMVANCTGCSKTEALQLQVDDVDLRGRTLTFCRKTRRSRRTTIVDPLVPFLAAQVGRVFSGALFPAVALWEPILSFKTKAHEAREELRHYKPTAIEQREIDAWLAEQALRAQKESSSEAVIPPYSPWG